MEKGSNFYVSFHESVFLFCPALNVSSKLSIQRRDLARLISVWLSIRLRMKHMIFSINYSREREMDFEVIPPRNPVLALSCECLRLFCFHQRECLLMDAAEYKLDCRFSLVVKCDVAFQNLSYSILSFWTFWNLTSLFTCFFFLKNDNSDLRTGLFSNSKICI